MCVKWLIALFVILTGVKYSTTKFYYKDRGARSSWYPSWWTTLSSSTTTTWSCWCSVWSVYVLVACMCCSTNSMTSDILLSLVGKVSVLPYSRLFSRGNFHKLAYSNFLRENFKNHQQHLVINVFSNIFNKHVKGNNVHEWQVICTICECFLPWKPCYTLWNLWKFCPSSSLYDHIQMTHYYIMYLYNSEDTATKIICKKHSKHFETWSWTTTINCWSRCSHHWWAGVHVMICLYCQLTVIVVYYIDS